MGFFSSQYVLHLRAAGFLLLLLVAFSSGQCCHILLSNNPILLVFQYFQVRPNLIYFILPKESPVVLQFSLFTLVRSSMLILQHYGGISLHKAPVPVGYSLQNLQSVQKIVNQVVSTGKIGKRSRAEVVKHTQMDLLMWLCRKFLEGATK